MFTQMEYEGASDLHLYHDAATGLQAIIAIHSTALGPAIGGCRFLEYTTHDDAIQDALRLAKGMSFKAALAGLPHGGGKSVINLTGYLTARLSCVLLVSALNSCKAVI